MILSLSCIIVIHKRKTADLANVIYPCHFFGGFGVIYGLIFTVALIIMTHVRADAAYAMMFAIPICWLFLIPSFICKLTYDDKKIVYRNCFGIKRGCLYTEIVDVCSKQIYTKNGSTMGIVYEVQHQNGSFTLTCGNNCLDENLLHILQSFEVNHDNE